MFSRLDPVFQSLPRQAESTDTRQDIRREEKTGDEGRKGGRDKEEKQQQLWEDSTVVSVRALRAFLAGLIARSAGGGHADVRVSVAQPPAHPPAQQNRNQPSTTESARAARAYKSMYYTGQKEHQPPLPAPPAAEGGIKLSPEEDRAIHKLIADIDILAARGVETLPINKSGSFLQSLVDAAALASKS